MQNWLNANGFIEKTEWPSSSPDLNLLDYHIWSTMLEKYHKLQLKHKITDVLKVAFQTIWQELPQQHINKAVANFTKCLTAYMAVTANGGHSKHLQYNSVRLQVCIFISSPTNRLFSEPPIDYSWRQCSKWWELGGCPCCNSIILSFSDVLQQNLVI